MRCTSRVAVEERRTLVSSCRDALCARGARERTPNGPQREPRRSRSLELLRVDEWDDRLTSRRRWLLPLVPLSCWRGSLTRKGRGRELLGNASPPEHGHDGDPANGLVWGV